MVLIFFSEDFSFFCFFNHFVNFSIKVLKLCLYNQLTFKNSFGNQIDLVDHMLNCSDQFLRAFYFI